MRVPAAASASASAPFSFPSLSPKVITSPPHFDFFVTRVHQVWPPDLSRAGFRRFRKLSRAYSPRSLNSELEVFKGASREGPEQLFQFELSVSVMMISVRVYGIFEKDDLRTREFDGDGGSGGGSRGRSCRAGRYEEEAEGDGGRGRRSPQNAGESRAGDGFRSRGSASNQANRKEVDSRSVFVGNVEYGQPKGYAYVEFVMPPSIITLSYASIYYIRLTNLVMRSVRLMILILPKEGLPDLDPPVFD
ncbi:polyadenylate-binding protein [Striga asiatica]|uniref:Polyadenylate-binding protein n=1 Tax=Striga asiatica TaxID=4170 RepID=A0A5A7Q544_STRAF|nr:polyadenylate-binding protein [Striga asiatica]